MKRIDVRKACRALILSACTVFIVLLLLLSLQPAQAGTVFGTVFLNEDTPLKRKICKITHVQKKMSIYMRTGAQGNFNIYLAPGLYIIEYPADNPTHKASFKSYSFTHRQDLILEP